MRVSELIELLQRCEPSATCALVDSVGVYELTGVQQASDRDAVFLTHVSTGFEAALGELPSIDDLRRLAKQNRHEGIE
jgi:hypothetical protein